MGLKRKQIVVLALVVMIVIAGYIQYSYNKSGESDMDVLGSKGNERLGESVYVDTELDASTENDGVENENGLVDASTEANDFFAQAKLDRQISVSKDTDALKEITDDTTASEETRAKAFDKMMGIIDTSQKEMRIENLIKDCGFSDVLAVFAEDGSLDIRVKSPSLTSSQVAQITDIASRQAKIDIVKIFIKTTY